ncbi:hypothetical protein AOQ84DRAFT_221450 [Glonium stellatum]|uniref:Uncharacterized protein n=1 Tax=Glonium stellatum TaxID=574774 RepID=A0A8E2F1R0_9PEZI|nr:hypothetical protein AOQ84DRAFT_221450 [Glonium stellatum]
MCSTLLHRGSSAIALQHANVSSPLGAIDDEIRQADPDTPLETITAYSIAFPLRLKLGGTNGPFARDQHPAISSSSSLRCLGDHTAGYLYYAPYCKECGPRQPGLSICPAYTNSVTTKKLELHDGVVMDSRQLCCGSMGGPTEMPFRVPSPKRININAAVVKKHQKPSSWATSPSTTIISGANYHKGAPLRLEALRLVLVGYS